MATTTPALPSVLFLLADDIGWADLGYNNGTAHTPNIDTWAQNGSVVLQDFHSGGTVCSPTRATILTGRHHYRDCVDYVYGCSDMSQCPSLDFEFAPSRTFTVGDAFRKAYSEEFGRSSNNNSKNNENDNESSGSGDEAYFAGKWHLGSFFNDAVAYGGSVSSPLTHGFNKMNATVEVAPTATTNCQCRAEWLELCDFGHYHKSNHCFPEGKGCCFNYWWDDPMAPHGVNNLTWPTPPDDSLYLADAFSRYLHERSTLQKPFLAQISFHNCHIPFIASETAKEACAKGETCRLPPPGAHPFTDEELDYYACLSELDNAVGILLNALKDKGYYDNTMIWFATDNGPEMNCPPEGICQTADKNPQRPYEGPGSAGPLRGRKRDIFEGGHRVPGIVSYPPVIKTKVQPTEHEYETKQRASTNADANSNAVISWETVTTMDFLPTVMEILGVDRPTEQQSWAMDGRSILPLLRDPTGFRWKDTHEGPRSLGLGNHDPKLNVANGYGYRYGKWKYVEGSVSCTLPDCRKPMLFDLESDLGERHDLSEVHPEVLEDLQQKFREWHASVMASRRGESNCTNTEELALPESMFRDTVEEQ